MIRLVKMMQEKMANAENFGSNNRGDEINIQDNAYTANTVGADGGPRRKNFFERKRFLNYE